MGQSDRRVGVRGTADRQNWTTGDGPASLMSLSCDIGARITRAGGCRCAAHTLPVLCNCDARTSRQWERERKERESAREGALEVVVTTDIGI